MVDPYLRQSPLAHLMLDARAVPAAEAAAARVWLREDPFRGQLVLRGDASKKAFRDAVEEAVGCAVPREPNTVGGPVDLAESPRILWLGPDEWLVVSAPGQEAALAEKLSESLGRQRSAVTDVSESRTVIVMGGPDVRMTLAKGCSIDLHPRVFAAGRCAQTGLARAHIILHAVRDDPVFELYVHRSFAEYAWVWLEDAADEYDLKIVT
jgi:sarcosine oxidase subunit gamma